MMESIGKLRELCAKWRKTSITPGRNSAADEVDAIADEIEREIAERFMELPVDADGVLIRIGDVVTWLNGAPSSKFTIDTFVFDMEHGEWDVKDSNFLNVFPAHRCRHVKPRTIEDVLKEFAYKVCDLSVYDAELERYADELRSMGVGE